jgi:hypothetical protein
MTATTSPATVPLAVSGQYPPDFTRPTVAGAYAERTLMVPDDEGRELLVPLEKV